MKMKSAHTLLGTLLLTTGLQAGVPGAIGGSGISDQPTGVPTPLEEFGLTIGDVTVTRVINPLGQLENGSPVLLHRRLEKITNPWRDLPPGTAVVVDGSKAVVQSISPEAPPRNGTARQTVNLRLQPIAGREITIQLRNTLHPLNSPETALRRTQLIDKVKQELQPGTLVVLQDEWVEVTRRSLEYTGDNQLDRNLEVEFDCQSLNTGRQKIRAIPSSSSEISHPAWTVYRDVDPPNNAHFANNTVHLITWKVHSQDRNENHVPTLQVLHRERGMIENLELIQDKRTTAQIRFTKTDITHIRSFEWALKNYTNSAEEQWAMENTGGTVTQLLRINDPKVDFKVTPDALMKANANTRAFFQRQKLGLNPGELSPANANEESFQATLKALSEIVNGGDGVNAGDVSEPLRMEAKRRAVIMLAMFYEQRAIHLQAKLRESEVRSAKTLEQARVFERESWLHRRKVALITDRLKTLGWTGLGKSNPDAPQLEDTLAEPKTFNDLKANLDVFQIALAQNTSGADLIIQLKTHLRKAAAQTIEAAKLRIKAKNTLKNNSAQQVDIIKYYNLSLQFWQEYMARIEGLMDNKSALAERGIRGNIPPPDPFIPEILIRRGWIYRQLNLPDNAASSFNAALNATASQRVDNLTRFSRISLVARSQSADAHFEEAMTGDHIDEAIFDYERLLKGSSEELIQNEVELRLLRCLAKANETSRTQLHLLSLEAARLEKMKTGDELDASVAEVNLRANANRANTLKQKREEYLNKMLKHANAFILRADGTNEHISHRQSGEVRYYRIQANKALKNIEQAEYDLGIVIDTKSMPDDQKEAWAATRVRVVIDIANLLFNNGKQLMLDSDRAQTEQEQAMKLAEAKTYIAGSVTYYQWAINRDQSYRSQIMLQQQIAFALERLNDDAAALDAYQRILHLCEMHPVDVRNSPVLRVTEQTAKLKVNNLKHRNKRQDTAKARLNQNT